MQQNGLVSSQNINVYFNVSHTLMCTQIVALWQWQLKLIVLCIDSLVCCPINCSNIFRNLKLRFWIDLLYKIIIFCLQEIQETFFLLFDKHCRANALLPFNTVHISLLLTTVKMRKGNEEDFSNTTCTQKHYILNRRLMLIKCVVGISISILFGCRG